MKTIQTNEMTHDEWLLERKNGIGASDASAVLGLNKYRTAYDVWIDKTSELPEIEEENPNKELMEAGIRMEEVISTWWAEETGMKVRQDHKIRSHPDYDFIRCNLDRTITENNGDGPGVLECKNTKEVMMKYWDDGPPLMHFTQIQMQLAITGYSWGEVAVCFGGCRFDRYPVETDTELINDYIIPRLVKFWENNVLKKVPPEPQNEKDVLALYPAKQGKVIEAAEETINIYQKLVDVRGKVSEFTDEKKKYEEQIKLALRDAETLTSFGQILITWKQGKLLSKFNEKGFAIDHPELYEKYKIDKPGSRRFLVK